MARTDLARRSRDNPNLFDEGAESRPPWTARDDRPSPNRTLLRNLPLGSKDVTFAKCRISNYRNASLLHLNATAALRVCLFQKKHGDQRRQRWMSSRT